MSERPKALTNQLVVRISDELHERLRSDAAEHGRTVAQSVRFHLARALETKAP